MRQELCFLLCAFLVLKIGKIGEISKGILRLDGPTASSPHSLDLRNKGMRAKPKKVRNCAPPIACIRKGRFGLRGGVLGD